MKIGENLKKFRKESGYSQQQVAEILKVDQSNISRWERDLSRPDYENLVALAKLYEVSVSDILDVD